MYKITITKKQFEEKLKPFLESISEEKVSVYIYIKKEPIRRYVEIMKVLKNQTDLSFKDIFKKIGGKGERNTRRDIEELVKEGKITYKTKGLKKFYTLVE